MTNIEWTEETWNPLAGCSKVSPGCKNCYAIRMAHRLASNPNKKISNKYAGLTTKQANGELNWTGEIALNWDELSIRKFPKKPTMFFVNSMSDLFHPKVPFTFIDNVYEVMGFHTEHIFQILTKHPERALEYYNWTNIFKAWSEWGHIWLGTSVENQEYADKRIPILLQIPAKVRWLSCEPLLGNIDLDTAQQFDNRNRGRATIDWIVVGGESGPGSRIMHPDWVRNLRDQCISNYIPFFFKQWGNYLHIDQFDKNKPVGNYFNAEFVKGGKNELGKKLDGRKWQEYPKKIK